MENNINPLHIEIDITHVCNFACRGCNRLCNIQNANTKSIMTLDDVRKISDELSSHEVKQINVIGGEPCTNPEVYEICLHLRNTFKEIPIVLVSNGSFKQQLEKLRTIKGLKFSIKKNPVDYAKRRHINLFDSRNFTHKEEYYDCATLNECGICVYKENDCVLWSKCANSMYISRMLGMEFKYSKQSLDELLHTVDDKEFFTDICNNCALYCVKWNEFFMKHKDFTIIDYRFKEWLINKGAM